MTPPQPTREDQEEARRLLAGYALPSPGYEVERAYEERIAQALAARSAEAERLRGALELVPELERQNEFADHGCNPWERERGEKAAGRIRTIISDALNPPSLKTKPVDASKPPTPPKRPPSHFIKDGDVPKEDRHE